MRWAACWMQYPLRFAGVLLSTVFLLINCEDNPPLPLPEMSIHLHDRQVLRNYSTSFSAYSQTHINESEINYFWDFGDGIVQSGQQVSHTFTELDSYYVSLTVSNQSETRDIGRWVRVSPSLELIASYPLGIESPSGLSFGLDKLSLWTVSDKPGGTVSEIDHQGNLVRNIPYYGTDLEGVCFDERDSSLWVIDEGTAELIHLDTNGVVLHKQWIAGVSDGGGLEGIAVNPVDDRIFLLKEKDNSALIVLGDSLSVKQYSRIGFASDYSGLSYSTTRGLLWMLSHENSSLYLTDSSGALLAEYGFRMEQAEGLAVDEEASLFYIVDDTLEELRVYSFWDQAEL